jgi:hypothetical protein
MQGGQWESFVQIAENAGAAVGGIKASQEILMADKNADTPRLVDFVISEAGENESVERPDSKRFGLFLSQDGVAFADIYGGATRRTWPVRSKLFAEWLSVFFFENERRVPTRTEVKSAITLIDGGGLRELPVHDVFVRVGQLGDHLYLDLADDEWGAVEIDSSGWRVVQNPPVRFERTPGMRALPVPKAGGSIELLRSFVNLDDEQGFVLVVAWLLAAMHQKIAKPILAIRGGEGSAKSTLVEILRGLVDPHDPPYTALPRTDLKLRAAAADAYCQAYDNISGLPASMSDALCRFVTAGSNQPVIINGISDIIKRPDLADRCVFIDCVPIPDWQRRTLADVMATFASARPQILGALLDAVVHGLQNQAQRPTPLPRMADFAQAVIACETMFWPTGTFRTACEDNRAEIVEALIGAAPVTAAVRLLVAEQEFWEGEASDLDAFLRVISGNLEEAKNWPAEPRLLANRLRDLAPSLLKIGIVVTFHRSRDHDRRRLITISANRPGPAGDDLSPEAATNSASAPSEQPVSGQKEGGEDHASVSAQIADAAETEKSELPSATPLDLISQAADAADATDAAETEKSELPSTTPPDVTTQATDAADAGVKDRRFKFAPLRPPVFRKLRYAPGRGQR